MEVVTIENVIEVLAFQIKKDMDSSDALKFTQSALNLAHVRHLIWSTGEAEETLEDMTSEKLLAEILSRGDLQTCPKTSKYMGPWLEYVVGIGEGHSAQVRLPAEDYDVLKERT